MSNRNALYSRGLGTIIRRGADANQLVDAKRGSRIQGTADPGGPADGVGVDARNRTSSHLTSRLRGPVLEGIGFLANLRDRMVERGSRAPVGPCV